MCSFGGDSEVILDEEESLEWISPREVGWGVACELGFGPTQSQLLRWGICIPQQSVGCRHPCLRRHSRGLLPQPGVGNVDSILHPLNLLSSPTNEIP